MKKGFTLIEMAVVLLIIGMLATLVLRGIYGTTPMARDTRRKGDLTNVATYLAQYLSKFGYYPNVGSWEELGQELARVGIVNALPQDPGGGRYEYYPCTAGNVENPNHFVLKATFEQSENEAPKLYEGTMENIPIEWSCGSLSCSKSSKEYCIGI